MSSKQLDSILQKMPSATAQKTQQQEVPPIYKPEKTERIVAVVPLNIKKQIRIHLENNPGETEKIIILKGLKAIGFSVNDEWLIDKRTTR